MVTRKIPVTHASSNNTAPVELSDRRHDILQAALACAADRGVEAISIEGVRALCGASVGSIYHHFGSREGVVSALYLDIFQEQSRYMQQALEAAFTARDGVEALVTGYLDWVVQHPERARFLFQARAMAVSGPHAQALVEASSRRHAAVTTWFGPHQASGEVQALPCELLPSLVMGPVQSYCRAWLGGNRGLPSPSVYRTQLASAAWACVGAPALLAVAAVTPSAASTPP
jgi:AcrR family transcriptional regulator